MLSAQWMVARVELRRRTSSLLVLAGLVALVTAVVLTALLGAQRTSSSVDRFRSATAASDASFQADTSDLSDEMLTVVRGVPEVGTAAARHLVNVFPEESTVPDIALMSDPEGVYGYQIDRPAILEGRMPESDAPDEVLLNELASEITGFGVGDRIHGLSWSRGDLEALGSEADFPGFNGPALDLEVVGVGRVPEELSGDLRRTSPFAIGSPAFLPGHPGVGDWPPAIVIRSGDGAAGIAAAARALAPLLAPIAGAPADDLGFYPSATTAEEVYLDTSQRTVDSLAAGLLVLAIGAALAGIVAVGQAVGRLVANSATSPARLSALGLGRASIAGAMVLPIVAVSAVGVLVGAGIAVAASELLPMGLARRAEVDPGVWFAPELLVPGALLALVAVGGGAFVWVHRRLRTTARSSAGRGLPALTRAVLRAGASPTVVTGVRLANERGRGTGSVPVRSALVGLAMALAGVLASGVVAVSLNDLEEHPEGWGWTWSTMPDYFGDGDINTLESQLLDDDRVDAVGELRVGSVLVGDTTTTGYSLESLSGSMELTSIDGRVPVGPTESALGEQTIRDLGVAIGDTITVAAADGGTDREVVVVGTVVIPPTEGNDLDVGIALTPEGLAAVGQGEALSSLLLRYPAGADAAGLEAALSDEYGLQFGPFAQPQTPASITNLAESRRIAWALAVFFVAIGMIGLAHALAVSTRRRRRDLAVLRALGMRRRQVRGAVLIQAVVLAFGGALVGIPVGLILGRLVWRLLTEDIGAVADPLIPWLLVGLTPVVAVVAAAVVSWRPGRAAVRTATAHQLASE